MAKGGTNTRLAGNGWQEDNKELLGRRELIKKELE